MLGMEQKILAAAKGNDREYYFMIFDICFWYASVFEPDLSRCCDSFLCPVCKGSKVQSIALAPNEVFGSKMLLKTTGSLGRAA
jgi:hypothetical protein